MDDELLERHIRTPYKSDPGTVYLLHLDPPFKHARHYIGFTRMTMDERMRRHHGRHGARLLRAQLAAGGTWRVAQVWPQVQRQWELTLKRRGGGARCCPICKAARSSGTLGAPSTTPAGD